jgi:hypothetical protein
MLVPMTTARSAITKLPQKRERAAEATRTRNIRTRREDVCCRSTAKATRPEDAERCTQGTQLHCKILLTLNMPASDPHDKMTCMSHGSLFRLQRSVAAC